jgi:3-deoxy-D-manno-octulosonic-acid transferase
MRILYNFVILIYSSIIHIVSLFNQKARLWVSGRENWYGKLIQAVTTGDRIVWVHCASLGEFEQGRPVIEKIKAADPGTRILLTFFSPSGYEIRKNYPLADYVCYLPADTPANASRFIDYVKPVYAVFIKYEFWNNYISNLSRYNIPVYLVSGIFRKEQLFFRWYGAFFRKLLSRFTHIFVQNSESVELLKSIGITDVTLAGDTRFDRVSEIAANAKDIPLIEKFRGNEKLLVAGSSWRGDEEIIAQYINRYPEKMKWIFAPHEIDNENIERIEKLFRIRSVRYSNFEKDSGESRILIIDNIGMLSSLYRYAHIAEIGGGFSKGIHNILEAAAWSIPVAFGPNYHKFKEAEEMIGCGGAKSFSNYSEFEAVIGSWLEDDLKYRNDALSAGKYVKKHTGSTDLIIKKIYKDINRER